jgi:DNA (cytosine-5)-methyltransferase 1
MNTVDLFAGAGGMSYGFEQAGYTTLCGVEFDNKAASTYRHNIPAPCIEYDLSERPTLPVSANQVDVLTGGPPCQGYSIAGDRNEDDARNRLVFDFLHYVDSLDPTYVVMENVEGILSMGDTVERIHETFTEFGYESDHRALDAEAFGVPQDRTRVIFLASKDGSHEYPDPSCESRTVGDSICRDFGDVPNQTTPRNQQKTIDRIASTEQGEALYDSYTQRIRLDPDTTAPTLVCGGPRPSWQQAHPTEDRGLTVRERASLQTFPDWYEFRGGVVSGRVQTGNAVPPKLAGAIAEALR